MIYLTIDFLTNIDIYYKTSTNGKGSKNLCFKKS